MPEAARRILLAGACGLMALPAGAEARTAWQFRFTAIEGGALELGGFQGKALLVVNTASFCGYTPQYAALERVHRRFQERGLVVLGVPSNDFNQESADARSIKQFCEANYDVSFPMTTPEHVKGPQAHPFFAWLADRAGGPPRWNFHKYLVARDSRSVTAFATRVEPEAPPMLRAIEAAISATPAA